MPIIINILPNVYWLYNNPNTIQPLNEYTIEMNKFIEQNHIKTIIDITNWL